MKSSEALNQYRSEIRSVVAAHRADNPRDSGELSGDLGLRCSVYPAVRDASVFALRVLAVGVLTRARPFGTRILLPVIFP